MLVHPSREVRYDCSKPKGNTCIQVVFTQSPVSLTTTSEYLPVSGFTVPSLHLSQSSRLHPSRFHKQLQQSKQRKSYLTCLRHCKTVQIPVKNMKANSQKSFLFRFKIQFKTVSTTYTVQVVSIDLQQYMLNSNTSTTAVQTNILGYLMHLRNQINVPKQVVSICHPTLAPLSTNSLNTKFHCAFSAMTVPISLSLSTLVPTLPGKHQCFRLQSQGHQSVQTSVKLHCSCTLLNLRCSIIHALHYKCGN